MRRNIIICLLLAGITLAIYWPVRNFDLISFDDPYFLTDSPEVRSGLNWHSFRWAMTSVVATNWHPVTSLSFVINHQLFGSNPGAEHLVNAVLHALNAAWLFLVLQRLTGCCWRSAMVAALFAWHPLRVESVAWISERKDMLNGFFLLLTLWAYARYAEKSKVRSPESKVSYGLALGFFALGLMSKAMLVTVPFLLLLLDFWPLKRVAGGEWRVTRFGLPVPQRPGATRQSEGGSTLNHLLFEKWPFFALSALFCVITFLVQHRSPAMPSLDRLGLGFRLDNVIASYLRYLGKTVWPVDLAAHYPLPVNGRSYLALWPDWQILAAALLLVCVSVLCVCQRARRPYLAVGWFWYLGTMLPVIGLVQVGGQGMADHYTYIPMIGPVISLVWLAAETWDAGRIARVLLTTAAVVVLAANMVLTRHQLQHWKNTVSLFQHTVAVTGENTMAEYILGLGLEDEGRISEAMVHYRIAMNSNPTIKEAFYRLGGRLVQMGKWAEAEQVYSRLLKYLPNDLAGHLGLAVALPHLGRKTEAIGHLKAVLQQDPDDPGVLNNLAWTLATDSDAGLRDGREAVRLAEQACELTHYQKTICIGTLAAAYAEAGRFDDAMATAEKACALAAATGEQDLLQKNQELLARYRNHQPYHEVASPDPAEPSVVDAEKTVPAKP
jgi:tetratricopeptide (TPR) repeat protein